MKNVSLLAVLCIFMPSLAMQTPSLESSQEPSGSFSSQPSLGSSSDEVSSSKVIKKRKQIPPPLQRTYSFCPASTKLHRIARGNDVGQARTEFNDFLPPTLIHQYQLYVEAPNVEIKALLLAKIRAHLVEKVTKDTSKNWEIQDSITAVSHLIQILKKNDEKLDDDFLQMLTQVKVKVEKHPRVRTSPFLRDLIKKMPSAKRPLLLKRQVAMKIAQMLLQNTSDPLGRTASWPLDLRMLVLFYYYHYREMKKPAELG